MTAPPLAIRIARPVTIILNSNPEKRFTVALIDNLHWGHKQAILSQCRIKFQQNDLSRVYVYGGQELGYAAFLPSSVTEVYVSNEEYKHPPGVVRIIATRSVIHGMAREQLKCVSKLPGVRLVVGFPDLHPGTRFPIGCAIAADDVYPALIGSDIGCGVAVYALAPSSRLVPPASEIANRLTGLDAPWEGDVYDWLETRGIHRRSLFDRNCLGTIGGGNHFADICRGQEVFDRDLADDIGIFQDALYLVVHTGSRGLGAAIQAAHTVDDTNPCLPTSSRLLHSYLTDHDYAVRWAAVNRDLVAHRIMMCLFDDIDDPIEPTKLIDVAHNSVTKGSLKLGSISEPTETWIHRKGAAPTDQEFVPCPGSRGDYTYIIAPSGDGYYNLHSLAHGAGRLRPRQELHDALAPPLESLTTTACGSQVVCTDVNLLLEERPEAYKAIYDVVKDMEVEPICNSIATLVPVVNYKVREGAGVQGRT